MAREEGMEEEREVEYPQTWWSRPIERMAESSELRD